MVNNGNAGAAHRKFHGWPLRLTTSPNKRTLYNFPMQSGGAEMLRHATWQLCEAGIVPVMLVHDGILFELDSLEQVALAKDIMRTAGREVCDGFEIGVDEDQILLGGARYSDKRDVAQSMWARSCLRWKRCRPFRGEPDMAKVFDLDKFKSEQPAQSATVKGRRRSDPFIRVPWEWIEQAARLTRSPTTLILMELLYASWRARSLTFPLPNARLKQ